MAGGVRVTMVPMVSRSGKMLTLNRWRTRISSIARIFTKYSPPKWCPCSSSATPRAYRATGCSAFAARWLRSCPNSPANAWSANTPRNITWRNLNDSVTDADADAAAGGTNLHRFSDRHRFGAVARLDVDRSARWNSGDTQGEGLIGKHER